MPDLMTTVDLNDSEDAAVILKIPSFKPVAGSSSSSGKNGDNANDSTPQITPPLTSRSPQTHLSAGISSPILRTNNDSQSPPIASLLGNKQTLFARDVIANSLSRTYNQQVQQQKQSSNADALSKASMDQLDQYKRPSISVIKSLGGTDFTRFATSPNMMSMHPNNSNSPSNLNNNSGKGTRPKRGKYRNYDRDSLVEAVKAVQRGEMSVHRAGSYYGVPHSTLEYKVKERHLMRPRKREPKPQPIDGNNSSSSASIKSHDLSGATSLRSIDKNVKNLSTTKSPLKTPPFPASSPNGMKMGMFDTSQLQYQQLFWPHPSGYSGLSGLDFGQRPSGASSSTTFPNNTEAYFASQMMQRLQEDSFRQSNAANNATNKTGTSTSVDIATAAASAAAAAVALNKSKLISNDTKETTLQSLYEGAGANGSFLDEIIRHSLDRKNDSLNQGAILNQLNKNRYSLMSGSDNDGNSSNKRPGSPFSYSSHAIKRERTSSSSGETDRESSERDIPKESVEALLKYRERLTNDLPEESNGVSIEHKASSHNNDNDDSS